MEIQGIKETPRRQRGQASLLQMEGPLPGLQVTYQTRFEETKEITD